MFFERLVDIMAEKEFRGNKIGDKDICLTCILLN